MKYFGYMPNDFINGEGVSVSLWTAGCPHRCPGCHNPEMWNYEDGYECSSNLIEKLSTAIVANGIVRNFSVLGGEPLADYNIGFVAEVVEGIRKRFPNIKIFLWTGYTVSELKTRANESEEIKKFLEKIFSSINIVIIGRYEKNKRDITLPLRGSSNQEIIEIKGDFYEL